MRTAIGMALWIGLTATFALAGEAYPIRLSSPAHVGDTRTVSVKTKRTSSVTWTDAAQPPTSEALEATLDGIETVDAVSDAGRGTRVTTKVTRCMKNGVQLLPAGATVVSENTDGHTRYTVDGSAPTEDVRQALATLIYTARPDEPTGDAIYGTALPRHVGDSWPANLDQLAKATRLPFPITTADLTGDAKLTNVATVSGVQVQTVVLTERCTFDSRPGRDGLTYRDLRMARDIAETVPSGPGIGTRHDETKFTIAFTATGPAGTKRVTAEDVRQRTYGDARK